MPPEGQRNTVSDLPLIDEGYVVPVPAGLVHFVPINLAAFQVDVDVLRTESTFVQHKIAPAQVQYPRANGKRSTMRVERTRIENEDDSKLVGVTFIPPSHPIEDGQSWPVNGGAMFMVENSDNCVPTSLVCVGRTLTSICRLNKFGEPRGFRIALSRGVNESKTSPNLLKSYAFAKKGIYVTKHKDTEPRAAHYDPGHPLIAFSNSGSLNQTEIVLWVNLGMHHVPHTGDLPNMVFTTAQSSFIVSPRVTQVKTFGMKMPSGTVNLDESAPDYQGDVDTRKFLYDHA
ncbi:copper amine oxidase [Mycena rebaudengoi]|nr:copper amine oxidase [Mycena rebaudengoi]